MKAYYDSTSEKTMHLRAVVGANGNVVARNYNPQHGKKGSLQSGDVGITVSIHGDTSDMPSAQAAAIRAMAVQMDGRVKERLGMDTQLGFAPGTVVLVSGNVDDKRVAVVEGYADGGLYIRSFTEDLKTTHRAYIPLVQFCVAEVPGRQGLEGLLLEAMKLDPLYVKPRFLWSEYAQSLLANEDSLVEVLWHLLNDPDCDYEALADSIMDRLSQDALARMALDENHDGRHKIKVLQRIKDQRVILHLAEQRIPEEYQEELYKYLILMLRQVRDQEWLHTFVLAVPDNIRLQHRRLDSRYIRLKRAALRQITSWDFLAKLGESYPVYEDDVSERLEQLADHQCVMPAD